MNKLTLPNLLSGLRLALALPSAWYTWHQEWRAAGSILAIAVATDFLDGWAARRLDRVSRFGGLLDHSSDAIFVTATLAALAALGTVPALLPVLVIGAFSQYVLDSRALAGEPLRTSLIGRYNGIAYFILAGFPILQHALEIYLLPGSWFAWLGWVLVITTLASMLDRLIAVFRLRLSR